MATTFLNYDPQNRGLYLATYRQPEGRVNEHFSGMLEDVAAERPGCCPVEVARQASYSRCSMLLPADLEEAAQAVDTFVRRCRIKSARDD